jgi:hypothetical protein
MKYAYHNYMDIVWGAIWVLGLLWVLYLLRPRKRKLSPASKARYQAELSSLKTLDPTLGIIQADRILEQILREKHGDRPLGENLKKYYQDHPCRDELWKLHKLRNQVVHEGESLKSFNAVADFINLIEGMFLD